jgi:hypothetical protein
MKVTCIRSYTLGDVSLVSGRDYEVSGRIHSGADLQYRLAGFGLLGFPAAWFESSAKHRLAAKTGGRTEDCKCGIRPGTACEYHGA